MALSLKVVGRNKGINMCKHLEQVGYYSRAVVKPYALVVSHEMSRHYYIILAIIGLGLSITKVMNFGLCLLLGLRESQPPGLSTVGRRPDLRSLYFGTFEPEIATKAGQFIWGGFIHVAMEIDPFSSLLSTPSKAESLLFNRLCTTPADASEASKTPKSGPAGGFL